MKPERVDKMNCRVYFRGEGNILYCYQADLHRNLFNFFRCSTDGEPEAPVIPKQAPVPMGDTPIEQEIRDFLGVQNDGTHGHGPRCARRIVSAAECTCYVSTLPSN